MQAPGACTLNILLAASSQGRGFKSSTVAGDCSADVTRGNRTMLEHLPHYLKVEALSPASAADTSVHTWLVKVSQG